MTMIDATAPGRCGIAGNPADMYGGTVLSCSTVERARCVLESTTGNMILEVSGDRQIISSQSDLALKGDRLDVARASITALGIPFERIPPFMLTASTEIPMQAGLAGSTAIIATIVGCLVTEMRLKLNRYQIAELVRKVEYEVIGTVCGFQDHYMAVFGGLNLMDFRGKSSAEAQTALSPLATVEPLQTYVESLPFILAHTGVKHHSGTVHTSLQSRWLDGDAHVVAGVLRVANLARMAKKALLSANWLELGHVMTENHAIIRDLGGSGDSNEALIKAALDGGAIAAKLAGAGGGGTILALTRRPETTVAALMEAGADSILYPAPRPGLSIAVRRQPAA